MSDSTTRYKRQELQDDEGNVIYPHTDADVVWIGNDSIGNFLKNQATDEEITTALID